MGAIFCHVKIMILICHINPSITLGSQKWKGAAPIFSSKLDEINKVNLPVKSVFAFKNILKTIKENNNVLDAKAWIKKYFKEDSEENKFFFIIIKGIKERRLISNPIHSLSQEVDEIAIKEPKIIEQKKTSL